MIISFLPVTQHFNGGGDITILRLFVSAAGQKDDGSINESIVHPVSGADIDAQFLYAAANGLVIASQTAFQTSGAANDRNFCLTVTQ